MTSLGNEKTPPVGDGGAFASVSEGGIEENPDTTSTYNVMSVPTMAVFVNGTVVKQIVGAKAKSTLLRELAEFL